MIISKCLISHLVPEVTPTPITDTSTATVTETKGNATEITTAITPLSNATQSSTTINENVETTSKASETTRNQSDCPRSLKWCIDEGQSFQNFDCDEDGIKDCVCTDTEGRMWTKLSTKGFEKEGPENAQCKVLGKHLNHYLKFDLFF